MQAESDRCDVMSLKRSLHTQDPQAAYETDSEIAALSERDRALLALSRERSLTNALRLAAASSGEVDPPNFPTAAGPGEPPLRYVLADKVNDRLKILFAPMHQLLRDIADSSKQNR